MQSGSGSSDTRGRGFSTGTYEVKSDINVTPLVDVCLVLLIIFMVVTPMLQTGVDVALPETRKPEKIAESQKQLSIAIRASGEVFIGDDWVPPDQLKARLEGIYAITPEKDVVLKADRRLRYADVRRVMATINEAGFSGLGLITTKKEQG
jgi:biopolymer transport protein ExbD